MTKRVDTPHIKYFDMGMFPLYFGLATSPGSFKKEINRIGIEGGPPFTHPGADATTWVFKKRGATSIIVCILAYPGMSATERASLLAHEAVHVWEAVLEHIGAKNPGGELQAYAVQHFTRIMLRELE